MSLGRGRNCIHAAILGNNLDTLKYLHSVDSTLRHCRDNDGNTALTLAVQYSNLATVKCCVEDLNCDPSEQSGTGLTPFLYAAHEGKIEVMRYLHNKTKMD